MKYMGSKNRYAKEILPIILEGREEGQWYVEPFVGGANVIDKVTGNRIGNDYHPNLIALLNALSNGWIPPSNITEQEYNLAKANKENSPLTGFIGFCASYSGKWFGGYARGNDNQGNPRNYADEAKRNLLKQAPNLKGVKFINSSYKDLVIPENSIVYCDPPYEGTTGYANKKSFDHEEFWTWCDDLVDQGHKVFVSEYNAPDHWQCVWQKRVNSSLTRDTGSKQNIERLFTRRKIII